MLVGCCYCHWFLFWLVTWLILIGDCTIAAGEIWRVFFFIKFTGKNYTLWSCQFQLYLEGKELWGHISSSDQNQRMMRKHELWGHISSSDPKPKDDEKRSWNTKDAKIKTWILESLEPHLILNLKPYKTAKETWEYLKKVYRRGISARLYQLQFEITQYTQGTSSRITTPTFLLYGLMMRSSMLMYLKQFCLRFKHLRN